MLRIVRVVVYSLLGAVPGFLLQHSALRSTWVAVSILGGSIGFLVGLRRVDLRRTARLLIAVAVCRLGIGSDQAWDWVDVTSDSSRSGPDATSSGQEETPRLIGGACAFAMMIVGLVATFFMVVGNRPEIMRKRRALDVPQVEAEVEEAIESGTAGEAVQQLLAPVTKPAAPLSDSLLDDDRSDSTETEPADGRDGKGERFGEQAAGE